MNNVIVIGKRWRGGDKGNAYHTATIFVDGNYIAKSKVTHGHGDQYQQTAMKLLYDTQQIVDKDDPRTPYAYCQDNKVMLYTEVIDVPKKSDL